MRPLQAHCHRGLGTLYATIGQREQARTELLGRHRPVPRHGHDLLAAPGGGGAGAGDRVIMTFDTGLSGADRRGPESKEAMLVVL